MQLINILNTDPDILHSFMYGETAFIYVTMSTNRIPTSENGMLWCGMSVFGITGPYFIEECLHSLKHWDRGFKSHSQAWMFAFICR
jgi:hypothetical protein